MNITIIYFAQLAEQLNCNQEQIDLTDDHTWDISRLRAHLSERDSHWKKALSDPSIRCAVNKNLAYDDTLVPSHSEVAFFPPMTGG